jgi:Cytochrome c554 and c-prime
MPSLRLLILTALIVTCSFAPLFLVGSAARESSTTASTPTTTNPSTTTRPLAVGKAGCSATGCHGRTDVTDGPMPVDCWKTSYTRWLDRDPHSQAYAVLRNEHSQSIMRNLLKLPNDAALTDEQQAYRDTRCLACHTNPTLAESPNDVNLDVLRKDGVSCEACHGNAERWQLSHVTWTSESIRTAELAKTQMIDLNPVLTRATECAGCHIGAKADPVRGYPTRDMNHDMIAAGHPRLEFDYAQYLQTLPKHWHEKHRGPAASDPGKLRPLVEWYAGQLAVEHATYALTLDRATRQPWPEFADWKCASCHRSLMTMWPPKLNEPIARRKKIGLPPYNGASFFFNPDALGELQYPQNTAEQEKLLQRLTMFTTKPPTWSPNTIQQEIDQWLKRHEDRKTFETLDLDDTRRINIALFSLDAARREVGGPVGKSEAGRRKLEESTQVLTQSIRELRAAHATQFAPSDSQQANDTTRQRFEFLQAKDGQLARAVNKCIVAFKENSAAIANMARLIRQDSSSQ